MKHPKERAMGVLVILFVGAPVVWAASTGIRVIEAYNRNYAFVLDGYAGVEFWILQAARLAGVFIILTGVVMLVKPEETVY